MDTCLLSNSHPTSFTQSVDLLELANEGLAHVLDGRNHDREGHHLTMRCNHYRRYKPGKEIKDNTDYAS